MAQRLFVCVVMALAGVHTVLSATAPAPVSPESVERVVPVEARCPTFTWSGSDGAAGYELIVCQIGEHGESGKAIMR